MFSVRVIPRSSRTEIVGEYDGAVKIKIASPPVDGAANQELIRFLAKTFAISKSSVSIISGETSKHKRIKLIDADLSNILEILQA